MMQPTKMIFRICSILALAVAASQTARSAQDTHTLAGVWEVTVTVTNCQTGALIRTVHSLQNFSPDGTFAETANTFMRGSSVGVWNRSDAGPGKYSATYFFYRYLPTGAFASTAQAIDMVSLNSDGSEFTASGTIQDFDVNNALLSTGCFVHSAVRLSAAAKDE
jgi:hypothetical protein